MKFKSLTTDIKKYSQQNYITFIALEFKKMGFISKYIQECEINFINFTSHRRRCFEGDGVGSEYRIKL